MTGLGSPDFAPQQFVFFTLQSNLLVFAVYAALVVRSIIRWLSTGALRLGPDFHPLVMGAVMLAIVITGAVYNFVLVPAGYGVDYAQPVDGSLALGNVLVHMLTPVLVLVDWLAFGDQQALRWWSPLTWTALPLAYLVFAAIRAEVGPPIQGVGRYPYPFLNVDALGWGRVALTVAELVAVFVVVAWVAMAIGRLVQAAARRTSGARRRSA